MFSCDSQSTIFSRRALFQSGLAAAFGQFSAPLLRAGFTASAKAKAKSVILKFNVGAPSHIDLWDPKPNAGEAGTRAAGPTEDTKRPQPC